MSFTCSLVRVIQHFCTIQSGELCWCDGLIKILNWDQDPERAAAANWGMVEAGGGSGAYSSLGKLEALRNNGMWVYLSPQINGTHGSANYLSDCGQYQAVQMNVVFTVFICLVFIQPVLHVVSQFSDGLKKWVSYHWYYYSWHCMTCFYYKQLSCLENITSKSLFYNQEKKLRILKVTSKMQK